jgi:hypothetical protein
MASTYLTRTPSSTGNRKIFTISAWIKRSKTGNNQKVITAGTSGTEGGLQFSTGTGENCLKFYEYVGSEVISIAPNRILRDTSAWYHVVIAVDTTQATASNRVKYYLNGVQETSFATATYPSQNYDTLFNNSGTANTIGFLIGHSAYFDGSMSHVHFIDGTAYDASYFGSTDSTTGEWKINTSPSVTYGTNGFFILKDGNSVTDQSGNSNNFTVGGGTLTKTEDCPSNVFATLNPLISVGSDSGNAQILSQGNLHVTGNQSSWCHSRGTFGASSGKWYWEVKLNGSTTGNLNIGVSNAGTNMFGGTVQSLSGNTSIYGDGQYNINGSITGSQSPTFSSGDICGVALNMDNNTVSFYKNGTILSWGTDLAISGGTDDVWLPASAVYSTSESLDFNFGNGYFGTTAVSSAGTNASGNGIFEYDVPTGYTALSTKGLNL